MGRSAKLVELKLTQEEASLLLAPAGLGGQQTFQKQIHEQLKAGSLVVEFNDEELGKLFRYMTQYGSGGFQSRLRNAFRRPLLELLSA